MLVPYSRQNNQKGGCCPGQTAHHLVPKHHFPKSEFKGYDEGDAPCVCAEGHSWHRNCEAPFNNADKTHPAMHDIQDGAERAAIGVVEKRMAAGQDVGKYDPDHAMDYSKARKTAVDAHHQVFPDCDPPCTTECLEAQLNAYHRQQSVGVRDGTVVHTKKVGAAED